MYNAQGELVCPHVVETFVDEAPNERRSINRSSDPILSAKNLLEARMFCQATLVRDPKTNQVLVQELRKECPPTL